MDSGGGGGVMDRPPCLYRESRSCAQNCIQYAIVLYSQKLSQVKTFVNW